MAGSTRETMPTRRQIPVVFVLDMTSILYYGAVLMVLWNWFMPATFNGLSKLSYPQSVGVMLVLALFLVSSRTFEFIEAWEDVVNYVREALFFGILFIGVGAFVHYVL